MWSICSVHKQTLRYAIQTKVPTVYKARSHDPKQMMSHGREGGGGLKGTGYECSQTQPSVCYVCGVVLNASDVALCSLNLQLLRCLNRRERPTPRLVTVQLKMGTW